MAHSVKQVAQRWNCSERTIYKMIERKELLAFKVGGKLLRVTDREIERWERAGSEQSHVSRPTEEVGGPTGEKMESRNDRVLEPTTGLSQNELSESGLSRRSVETLAISSNPTLRRDGKKSSTPAASKKPTSSWPPSGLKGQLRACRKPSAKNTSPSAEIISLQGPSGESLPPCEPPLDGQSAKA